jgi:hypothetical protein
VSSTLYLWPWVVWFLWFVGWEAWGFRRSNDRWPTLSEVVKGWEGFRTKPIPASHMRQVVPVRGGMVTWSWRRWFIALGLPVFALVLELHWVWEVF